MKTNQLTSLLIILLGLCLQPALQAQNSKSSELLKIPLKTEYLFGRGTMQKVIPLSQVRLFKPNDFLGIPSDWDEFRLFKHYFQRKQYLYQAYVAGRVSQEDLQKTYRVDLKDLSPKAYSGTPTKATVNILCGYKGNHKLMVIDANNNHDFSDDYVYKFDATRLKEDWKTKRVQQMPTELVHYEYYDGKRIVQKQKLFKFLPYNATYRYKNEEDDKFQIYLYDYAHQAGYFEVAQKRYKVVVDNQKVNFGEMGKPLPRLDFANRKTLGDLLTIGNYYYRIEDIKADMLTLQKIDKHARTVGRSLGQFAPNAQARTLRGDILQLNKLKGKYVILDFWGTWCKPCLQLMPQIQALHKTIDPQEVVLVSIASDENIEKVKKAVKKHQMTWINLFEKRGKHQTNSFVSKFKLTAYPSMFVINPEGRIIHDKVSPFALANSIRQVIAKDKALKNKKGK